jgi:hypothetical protein
MSLKAMATPAVREPGPLVTRWRSRTVAKVDSMVRGSQMHPVLGGVVELQQDLDVVGDLRDGLAKCNTAMPSGDVSFERVVNSSIPACTSWPSPNSP